MNGFCRSIHVVKSFPGAPLGTLIFSPKRSLCLSLSLFVWCQSFTPRQRRCHPGHSRCPATTEESQRRRPRERERKGNGQRKQQKSGQQNLQMQNHRTLFLWAVGDGKGPHDARTLSFWGFQLQSAFRCECVGPNVPLRLARWRCSPRRLSPKLSWDWLQLTCHPQEEKMTD